MNSERAKKIQSEVEKLRKLSDVDLIQRITNLRNESLPELTPHLIEKWSQTKNEDLREVLYQFFGDTKDQAELNYFVEAIRNEEFKHLRNELLSVLWQSSLDTSEYLDELIEWAIEGDYMTIVEVSTVIDSMESEFSEDQIMDNIYRIDEGLIDERDEDRIKLLNSLKDVVASLYTA